MDQVVFNFGVEGFSLALTTIVKEDTCACPQYFVAVARNHLCVEVTIAVVLLGIILQDGILFSDKAGCTARIGICSRLHLLLREVILLCQVFVFREVFELAQETLHTWVFLCLDSLLHNDSLSRLVFSITIALCPKSDRILIVQQGIVTVRLDLML